MQALAKGAWRWRRRTRSGFWLWCILGRLTPEGSNRRAGTHRRLARPAGLQREFTGISHAPAGPEMGEARGISIAPVPVSLSSRLRGREDATPVLGDIILLSPSSGRNLVLPLQVMLPGACPETYVVASATAKWR